jgi:predicted nucleic acid-binding protein
MCEAVADTGPILHLHQISFIHALRIVERLIVPDLVMQEWQAYHVDLDAIAAHVAVNVTSVARADWEPILAQTGQPVIHPADAQVFVVAQAHHFQLPVFTDDLALRQRLEHAGATAVGSVGILVRAYTTAQWTRTELNAAIDALFTTSTLHMSKAFRAYVRQQLEQLP